jgi:caffeoyl-CoA O-methyltransferase
VSAFQARELHDYLTDLAGAQHHDQVLVEMEARASELGFPIVGRAVGRTLELLALAIGARRVVELGSGYGYSAYWFARAVGEDGEVVCTDGDAGNALLAEGYLRRAGLWDRVRYRVGDALEGLAAEEGEVDVVYCDVDKDGYPDCWRAGAERLRVGGLWICDNTLWDGRVVPGLDVDPDEFRDGWAPAIAEHNRLVAADQRFVSSLLPIRDGVTVAVKVEA